MKNLFRLAAVFAAGALAMYYLDPLIGRRRRARVRSRAAAMRHDLEGLSRNRARYGTGGVEGSLSREHARMEADPVDDVTLHERIRARLGHVVDHASDVEVVVQDGHVVLSGSALASEIDDLLQAVWAVPGVADVDNRLQTGDARLSRH